MSLNSSVQTIPYGENEEPIITFGIATYKQHHELRCLLHGIASQTCPLWKAIVVFDGADEEEENSIKEEFKEFSDKITVRHTPSRENIYGHNCRNLALAESTTKYTVLTSGDNYYSAHFVSYIREISLRTKPDVILVGCAHDGFMYKPLAYQTRLVTNSVDIGQLIFRSDYGRKVGGIRGSHATADGSFAEALTRVFGVNLRIHSIDSILYVHN